MLIAFFYIKVLLYSQVLLQQTKYEFIISCVSEHYKLEMYFNFIFLYRSNIYF